MIRSFRAIFSNKNYFLVRFIFSHVHSAANAAGPPRGGANTGQASLPVPLPEVGQCSFLDGTPDAHQHQHLRLGLLP
jgi:hypothetical protein